MMMSIRNWVRRHKTALLVSASAAGIGYFCYRSVKAHYHSVQEREAFQHQAEQHAEAQLQFHFTSVQHIADTTTLPTVLPHLKSQLLDQLDLSGLTGKLMQGKDAPQVLSGKEKYELWETLKILSFTRAVSSMCALTLMVLFVRIQLNVLGRWIYIYTARDISSKEPVDEGGQLSIELQQRYIKFAEFLPHEGLRRLIVDTREAVEHALASKSLREPCTSEGLLGTFQIIGRTLKNSKTTWLGYMLPKDDVLPEDLLVSDGAHGCVAEEHHYNDEKLQSLLDETRAILDSEEFKDLLSSALVAVLDKVIEEFSQIYEGRETIHFAKLIPPVASLGDSLLEQPDDNKYVQVLTNLPELKSFCATVYAAGNEQVG